MRLDRAWEWFIFAAGPLQGLVAGNVTMPQSSGVEGYLGPPVDMWALGCVVYELFHPGKQAAIGGSVRGGGAHPKGIPACSRSVPARLEI